MPSLEIQLNFLKLLQYDFMPLTKAWITASSLLHLNFQRASFRLATKDIYIFTAFFYIYTELCYFGWMIKKKLYSRLDYFSVLFLSQLIWEDICEESSHNNLVKIANYPPKLLSSFFDEEIKSSLLDGSWSWGGDYQGSDGSCDDFQSERLEIIPVVGGINIGRLRLGFRFS